MVLSQKARADLRIALEKSYCKEYVDAHFTEQYVDEIGDLLLTFLAEVLKMRVARPELFLETKNPK